MTRDLEPLIEHFNRCLGGGERSGEALANALDAPPGLEGVLGHARFDAAGYVRVPLFRSDAYELRLLCWAPGQSSPMHGHGDSACALRVLTGEATEYLTDGAIRRHRVGAVAAADADDVHQVGNLGAMPLVSLHVYAPPLAADRSSPHEGRRIVVIGGGLCGAAVAIRLLAADDPSMRITLVEPGPAIGRGVAYGTSRDEHRLNVPAARMSLDPADPDDFVRFARERLGTVSPDALLPRGLYGDYVRARLERAIVDSAARLRVARCSASSVRPARGAWAVALSDGRTIDADEVVLATGHGPAQVPAAFDALTGHRALVSDPWAPGALDAIARHERVLVVGTGLTAVDVVSTLRANGHAAPVRAVSRHGRWPRPHLATVRWAGAAVRLPFADAPTTADGLARWLSAQVEVAFTAGVPWQAVLDAVRHHVAELWETLPDAERAAFLRDHRSVWEIYRHRVDRRTWDAMRAWRDEGWLTTEAGDLTSADVGATGVRVTVTRDGEAHVADYDRIVLCCGNASDPRRFDDPLWRQLLADGLATPDVHGLGVETDDRGGLVAAGRVVDGLWALGGLLRPRWFESTSVPDLSKQADRLAAHLVARATASARPTEPLVVPYPA